MIKGKILVIDDEEEVREVIQLHLEQEGYHILEAKNGEQAIEILRSGDNLINVGVILCDIRMPKVNGLECIDFLRVLRRMSLTTDSLDTFLFITTSFLRKV